MRERLLGFVFFAILLGYTVNWLLDKIHAHFSANPWFQAHWLIYYAFIPAALLLGLAVFMGFFRRGMSLLGNILALVTIAGVIYLMLGAGYSCWKWCF